MNYFDNTYVYFSMIEHSSNQKSILNSPFISLITIPLFDNVIVNINPDESLLNYYETLDLKPKNLLIIENYDVKQNFYENIKESIHNGDISTISFLLKNACSDYMREYLNIEEKTYCIDQDTYNHLSSKAFILNDSSLVSNLNDLQYEEFETSFNRYNNGFIIRKNISYQGDSIFHIRNKFDFQQLKLKQNDSVIVTPFIPDDKILHNVEVSIFISKESYEILAYSQINTKKFRIYTIESIDLDNDSQQLITKEIKILVDKIKQHAPTFVGLISINGFLINDTKQTFYLYDLNLMMSQSFPTQWLIQKLKNKKKKQYVYYTEMLTTLNEIKFQDFLEYYEEFILTKENISRGIFPLTFHTHKALSSKSFSRTVFQLVYIADTKEQLDFLRKKFHKKINTNYKLTNMFI